MDKVSGTASKASASGKSGAEKPAPPKKPLTAYFMYMQQERANIVNSLAGNPSIGEVTKAVGAKWRGLSPEEKNMWSEKAAEEKARYKKEFAAYTKKYGMGTNSTAGSKPSITLAHLAMLDTVIPLTRVKKLIKKDPDVKNISREALHLLTKCADMFTLEMSQLSHKHAARGKHKNMTYDDIVATVRKNEKLSFLLQDFPDKATKSKSGSKSKVARGVPAESGPLSKFLSTSSSSSSSSSQKPKARAATS